MTKKEIMAKAVRLARAFEGDWAARMALALRIVWKEARAPKKVFLSVRHQPSGGKEWVAEIIGRHPKYRFERRFLTPFEKKWSYSGKTGITIFELEEGKTYEINEPYEGRCFVKVISGRIIEISATEIEVA